MMKKHTFMLVSIILFLAFILLLIIVALQYSDYRTKHFSETLDIEEEEITKIVISSPEEVGEYKTTTNREDIRQLLDYFNQIKYKRLIGDQTSYMPMQASIIYIYKEDDVYFIVPYGPEAMISYKVYQIKNGEVAKTFMMEYYHSLPDD